MIIILKGSGCNYPNELFSSQNITKIDRHIDYLPDVVSSRCLKMILMFLYSANLHVCNNLKLFIAAYTTEKMRVWDSISEISGHM